MYHSFLAAFGPTSLFVLLWCSGAIISEIGLRHGSPFALLFFRYLIGFVALTGYALWQCVLRRGVVLPAPGTRGRVAMIGFLVYMEYRRDRLERQAALLEMRDGEIKAMLHGHMGRRRQGRSRSRLALAEISADASGVESADAAAAAGRSRGRCRAAR